MDVNDRDETTLAKSARQPLQAARRGRIVLVDDDEGVLLTLRLLLEQRRYECAAFSDPREAMADLCAAPADAVITDITMPGVSGLELCEEIANSLGAEAPPCLVLSGVEDEETMQLAYALGAADYLVKPIRSAELYAKVERAIASRRPACAPARPAFPERLGPYHLLELLGHGASGAVFLGERDDGVRHAVKLLWPEQLADVDAIVRFRREADVLSSLSHDNVVRLHHAGRDGSWYYYAMDLLPGGALDRHVQRHGPLDPEAVLEVIEQIAAAICYLEEQGIVHRDVKPANILFDDTMPGGALRVVLSDFGIAKRRSDHISAADDVRGTPFFIAPEVLLGDAPSIAADLYALGMSALWLLYGRSPMPAHVNAHTIFQMAADGALPRPSVLCPLAPRPLLDLLELLTAPAPEERPASVAATLAAVAQARAALAAAARPCAAGRRRAG
jgi:CheY-like chemotaxis protein